MIATTWFSQEYWGAATIWRRKIVICLKITCKAFSKLKNFNTAHKIASLNAVWDLTEH